MAGYNSFNLDFGMAQLRQETLRQERAEGRLAREARRAAAASQPRYRRRGSRLRLSVVRWLPRLGGAAILGCLVFSGTSAAGRAEPSGGLIRVFVTPDNTGAPSTILLTGAIGDAGTVLSSDKNGETDTNGNYVKLILKKGTVEVNATRLGEILDKVQWTVDTATGSGYMPRMVQSHSSTAPDCIRALPGRSMSPQHLPH
jgi:hypothetical protein